MRIVLLSLLSVFSFQAYAACGTSSGNMVFPSGSSCNDEPDYYGITIYEMGLCTSNPTAPTSSSALVTTSCSVVYSNSSGTLVSVQNGLTSDLPNNESAIAPADGAYTHGYVKVSNDFLIKFSSQFSASLTADDSSTGAYCGTKTATYKNDGTSGTDTSQCASSTVTAGTLTSRMVDFSGGNRSGCFSLAQSGCGGSISTTGGSLGAYLVDSNGYLAAATGSITNLVGVQEFSAPVTVTSESTGMDVAFRVSQGMTVSDNGSGGIQFDSGPFYVVVSVN